MSKIQDENIHAKVVKNIHLARRSRECAESEKTNPSTL